VVLTQAVPLTEWMRFLEVRTAEDAAAALARQIDRLDDIYAALCSAHVAMYDAPTGEVPEVLMVARTTTVEAIDLLRGVAARFREPHEAG
jgi:hypothetical protein